MRGLGGRRALSAGRRRAAALVTLLALAVSVAELQRVGNYLTLAFIADRGAFRSPLAHALFQGQLAVHCAAPLVAGVLLDLYGVRRVVALTIVGWCGFVSLGVSLVAPLPYRLGAPLADELVPGFLLCAAFVALARALDPRRRSVAAMIVLLIYQAARERPHVATGLLRSLASGWQEMMFLLVAGGAFAATIWLAAFREASPRRPAGMPPETPPSSRDLVVAVGAVSWCSLAFAAVDVPSLDVGALRRGLVAANVPALLGIVVALLAAWSGDRLARRLGSPPASRVAVLVPGFLAVAFVGLVDLFAQTHEPSAATALLVALAAGLLQVVNLLAIDRAPRQAPGLFVGTVLTAAFVSIQYVGPLARSLLPHDALAVAAGLAGALWSGLLLRRGTTVPSAGRGRGDGAASQASAGEQRAEGEQRDGGAGPGQAGVA